MDKIDKQIIDLLKENSKQNYKEIGERIHMTGQAIGNRIRKLEDEGVIEGYTLKVNNPEAIIGYITLIMKDNQHYRVKRFVQKTPDIVEAARISGEGCYIIKVEVQDYKRLDELCDEVLKFANYRVNVVTQKLK